MDPNIDNTATSRPHNKKVRKQQPTILSVLTICVLLFSMICRHSDLQEPYVKYCLSGAFFISVVAFIIINTIKGQPVWRSIIIAAYCIIAVWSHAIPLPDWLGF